MNTKTKYIAQCLSLLYTGVSENQAKRILHCISKATGIEEMTLPAMRRTLFACSCICDGIQRVVCCPKCGEWSLTNKVFCPRCCTEAHERDDMEAYRLFECGCKECGGNPSVSRNFLLHQKIEATCCHLSRRVLGRYVLYVPPESIIADFFASKLVNDMVGLEEDEILRMCEEADSLGFHHNLLSVNAKDIYEEFGWERAAAAVNKHLSSMKSRDGIAALKTIVEAAEENKKQRESGYSFLILPVGVLSADLLPGDQRDAAAEEVEETESSRLSVKRTRNSRNEV